MEWSPLSVDKIRVRNEATEATGVSPPLRRWQQTLVISSDAETVGGIKRLMVKNKQQTEKMKPSSETSLGKKTWNTSCDIQIQSF